MKISTTNIALWGLAFLNVGVFAEPIPALEPTQAPNLNAIYARQLEGILPGMSGSVGPAGACGTLVGGLAGCVGPEGPSGAIPGASGSVAATGAGGGVGAPKTNVVTTATSTSSASGTTAVASRTTAGTGNFAPGRSIPDNAIIAGLGAVLGFVAGLI